MAFEPIKRYRYFFQDADGNDSIETPTGKTEEEDLKEFHRPLNRMQLANLEDWGIARGLKVIGIPGETTITIKSGVAIDSQGELISLSNEGFGNVIPDPSNPGSDEEKSVPIVLDISSYPSDTYNLTIQHFEAVRINDEPLDPDPDRREQVPKIRLQPVSEDVTAIVEGTAVVLAIVKIDPAGQLALLSAQDSDQPHRRRLVGKTVEQLQIRRTEKVGDTIEEVTAGKLGPVDGGGLRITVPDGNLKVEGTVEATAFQGEGVVPTGAVLAFAGSTPSLGWLLCDGAAVNREEFQRLFDVIGTTYGEGDGFTTFNLPDLRGQTAIGAGTFPGLTTRNLGEMIGTESHTLSTSEIPQHTHSGTTDNTGVHTHSGTTGKTNLFDVNHQSSSVSGFVTQRPRSGARWEPSSYFHQHKFTTENAGEHAHNFVTDGGNGEGIPHNNMQPSLVLNHIIKT